MKKIYAIYDNDKLIAKGDVDEIAEKIGYSSTTIRKCCREGTKIKKRFTVKLVCKQKQHYRTFNHICGYDIEKPKTTMEYLLYNLYEYGNTTLKDNPQKYEEELKKEGIKIKYHKSIYDKKSFLIERTK